MKKGFRNKNFFIILIFIFFIFIGGNVLANSENIVVKKSDYEYILYFENLKEKQFEFAFANQESQQDSNLNYIINGKDSEKGLNIAYIDSNLYNTFFKNKTDTYIWIKSEGKYIYKNYKIDLENYISNKAIEFVKNTTKRIELDFSDKEIKVEEKDGIKYTTTRGKAKIVGNKKADYSYQIIKYTNESEYTKLLNLINKMKDQRDTVTELKDILEFNKTYNELFEGVKNKEWIKVQNNEILQPLGSKTGEKYILWIKSNVNNIETIDIQVLETYEVTDKEFITEKQVIKTASKLPITYDNITLFIILLAGVVVLGILFIIRKNIRNKNEK